MESLLNNFHTEQQIIQAIESNQLDFFKCYARTTKGSFYQDKNIFWVKSGIPLRAFNGVFYNNFPETEAEKKIAAVKKEFQQDGLPFMWWTTPSAQPQNLSEKLEKNGLKLFAQTPGMALLMAKLNSDIPLCPDLTISKVENEAGMALWLDTALQSFGIPLSAKDGGLELFNNLRLDKSCIYYLGFMNGQPATVSLLFCGATVAGIYWVGTLSDARKKGAGATITLQALQEAGEMGYTLATLKASALGYPIYQKLGFQEYCKMGFHVTL